MSLIAANLTANYTSNWQAYSDDAYGQIFEVPSGENKVLTSIDVFGYFVATPSAPMHVAIFSVAGATAVPMTSALVVASRETVGLGTVQQWVGFDFSPYNMQLAAGEYYAFVCYNSSGAATTFKIGYDTSGIYSGGVAFRDLTSPLPPGTTNTTWVSLAGDDMIFRVWATAASGGKAGGGRMVSFAGGWGW